MNDRLFNMDVVIFRWIMTGKIGIKIVVARCVCQAENMPKYVSLPGLPAGLGATSQRRE